MKFSLADYQKLKDKIEKSDQTISRLKGKIDALMETLKKDFKCSTIAQTKKLLKKTEKESIQIDKELNTAYAALRKRWAGDL